MLGSAGFFDRIGNTWSLIGTSWDLLKKDKEMLVFPLISGICLLLVLGSFGLGILNSQDQGWQLPAREAPLAEQVAYYGKLFIFYFCTYFIIMFFNTGIVTCAVIRMRGGDPTLMDGFRVAFARVPLLLGWALLSATVGLILRIIEDRSRTVGRIVAGLLGMAWSLTTFLALPILVVEGKGPFAAVKQSTKMLKDTWGEQLVGGFSFGLLWFVCCLPGLVLFAVAVMLLGLANILVPVVLLAVYMIVLALVFSVMQTVFQAALYYYARDSVAPPGWDVGILAGAVGSA